jgi:2-dehydro-3-deoxyphosphogluconate aldolase/(4S)-4-hydroxy-2-oxoglutarate aldolase
VVKFFPAEQSGGLEYIKAIAAPYTSVRFIPTGGINAGNIAKYIHFNRVLACGGSWMVPDPLINDGNFDRISALCREAIFSMLDFSVVHFGINESGEEEAAKSAKTFEALFGFALRDGIASIFVHEAIELMKKPGLGTHGHIGIGTTSVKRAIAVLERRGIEFNTDSIRNDPVSGDPIFIYLKNEIAGFAVHLVQKK